MCEERRIGTVTLVGAGPGDPELLTLKAVRLLEGATVIAYDELVSDEIRALFPDSARAFPVGRRANGPRHHEERIHPEVIRLALAGSDVVRLKGGDPMLFGRGGEEIEALEEAGIPWLVVPGVTASLGAAASFGFPLTHRDVASHVTFATAHFARDDSDARALELARGIPEGGTVVLYMGLGSLARLARAFIASGRAEETKVAVVSRATLPGERIVRGTLGDIAVLVEVARLASPALVVIGEVSSERVRALVPPPAISATRIRVLDAAAEIDQRVRG